KSARPSPRKRRKRRRLLFETLEDRTLLDVGLSQLFVEQAYTDLLGRSPEPAGEQYWIGQLQQGLSRQAVALDIIQSPEYWAKQVREAYQDILQREPEFAGFQGWVANRQIVGGESNLLANFFGSAEYFRNAGSTIDGFVHALYHDILERDPETGGGSAWGQALVRGSTFVSVASQILSSPEANGILVGQLYHQYFARWPEQAGLLSWRIDLSQGMSREDFRSQLVGSTEYFSRFNQSNQDAVLHWNHVLLETVQQDATTPPLASRNMAIVQAAVADAVNAITGAPAYF